MDFESLKKTYQTAYDAEKQIIINAYAKACENLNKNIYDKNILAFPFPYINNTKLINESEVKKILKETYNIPESNISFYYTEGHEIYGGGKHMISIKIL
jgi:hypothetical protein